LLEEEFFEDEECKGMMVALGSDGGSCCIRETSGIKASLVLSEIDSSR